MENLLTNVTHVDAQRPRNGKIYVSGRNTGPAKGDVYII